MTLRTLRIPGPTRRIRPIRHSWRIGRQVREHRIVGRGQWQSRVTNSGSMKPTSLITIVAMLVSQCLMALTSMATFPATCDGAQAALHPASGPSASSPGHAIPSTLAFAPADRQGSEAVTASAPESPADPTNAATQRQAEILLRAARNSVAMGDLTEALTRFETLLRLTPHADDVRFEYAGLLLQAGKLSAGRRQLERLVAQQPDVGKYRLALADVLLRLKDYKAARDQLRGLLGDEQLGSLAAIKMAQSLVLDDRVAEARAFYDKHVETLRNLDLASQIALAQLLIDMQRPAEAVRLLKPLREAHPADQRISAALVVALVRTNERLEALDLIAEMRRQPITDMGTWSELAARMYREQAFPESLALYEQAWKQHPDDRELALHVARTHLRLFQVEHAKQVLDRLPADSADEAWSCVMIDYYTLVGDYAEAIALAKQRLQRDAGDLQAAILLADAYHASRQFAAAEVAYAGALARCSPKDEEGRQEIIRLQAKNYLLSRKFEQAIATLQPLLHARPNDVGGRVLMIEALTQTKRYTPAAALAQGDSDEESPRDRYVLSTQVGYVYLKQGRWAEAAEVFRSLSQETGAPSPDVAYGLCRAATLLNQPDLARDALRLGPNPLAPAACWGTLFAGRAMAYCDCGTAAAVLDEALSVCPGNIVLLNLRGEAAQLCDGGCACGGCDGCGPALPHPFTRRQEACPPAAYGWFQAVLQRSPNNIRARLGYARSLNKHMDYECAYAEYLLLLKLMPNDVNLTREAARMLEGWRGLGEASAFYNEREAVFARESAAEIIPAPPAIEETKTSETDHEEGDAGKVVTKRTSAVVGESEPRLFGSLLTTDFQARYLRGWRVYESIPAFQQMIEMEPGNDSAVFDLAQSHSSLNRTQCAIETYQRLLEANPCHQDASVALLRSQLELQPKILSVVDYENQFGRQGLANMTWLNISLASRRSLGDENEFFEWGFRERLLQPTDDRADFGEIPFFRWQEKYANDSLIFAEVAVEKYQYGLNTRPTFTAGLDLIKKDNLEVRFSGFLKNYYVCGEAIRQDIYTTGVQMDFLFRPRRLWTLGGYYRYANFSDNNSVNWLNLNSAHILKEGRKQIRGLIDCSYYGFAQQTIFGPNPDSLVGTIHPYWSPASYAFTTFGLEWKHWLSPDKFKGANEHYYTIFSGAAVDSNGVPFFVTNARWQRDLSESMTWTIDFNLIRSPDQVYNAVGATTYGVWRLW